MARSSKVPDRQKIKKLQSQYNTARQEFMQVSKQISNINDRDADFESLKNSIDNISDDVSAIRLAMLYVYYDTRKIKRKITHKNSKKKQVSDRHI